MFKDEKATMQEKMTRALLVLTDNGIAPDEAGVVLQALAYTMMDMEVEQYIPDMGMRGQLSLSPAGMTVLSSAHPALWMCRSTR